MNTSFDIFENLFVGGLELINIKQAFSSFNNRTKILICSYHQIEMNEYCFPSSARSALNWCSIGIIHEPFLAFLTRKETNRIVGEIGPRLRPQVRYNHFKRIRIHSPLVGH